MVYLGFKICYLFDERKGKSDMYKLADNLDSMYLQKDSDVQLIGLDQLRLDQVITE